MFEKKFPPPPVFQVKEELFGSVRGRGKKSQSKNYLNKRMN